MYITAFLVWYTKLRPHGHTVYRTIFMLCVYCMYCTNSGAAFGRLVGECMAAFFPHGINGNLVSAGGYAVVGESPLHNLSSSVTQA